MSCAQHRTEKYFDALLKAAFKKIDNETYCIMEVIENIQTYGRISF
jgi:hypothetical protein